VLTDDELRVLLGSIAAINGSAYGDLLLTLLHTAMRRNEAASLQARDLDFARGVNKAGTSAADSAMNAIGRKDRSHNIAPSPRRHTARRGTCSLEMDFASCDAIRLERAKCPRIE
jgi:integrase